MADFLSLVLSFPPESPAPDIDSRSEYEQKARDLVSNLQQFFSKDSAAELQNCEKFLDVLHPAKQSLGYLFILLDQYQRWQPITDQQLPGIHPGGVIWDKTLAFLSLFDPFQVRYAGYEFTELIDNIVRVCQSTSQLFAVIQPLQHAILQLDPSGSTFTTRHRTFVRSCLALKCYLQATIVLDKEICHFPATIDSLFIKRSEGLLSPQLVESMSYVTMDSGLPGSLTHKSYLEYFLYGAMIYIGLGRWERANHFLQVLISVPIGSSVSALMVHGYKKWILVNLMENGSVPSMPHTVSASAAKLYKALAKPYHALAVVFQLGTLSRLQAEIQAGMEVWHKDHNTGLVFQVLDAFRQYSIIKHGRAFAALSLSDISRLSFPGHSGIQIEDLTAELLSMRRIDARLFQLLDSNATILRFGDSYPLMRDSREEDLWETLIQQKKRMDILLDHLWGTDFKFELGYEYVEGLKKAKWRKNGDDREGSAFIDDKDIVEFEEDIMAELR